MDMLSLCLSGVRLIGWTLVHFVWQGILVGLMYALARVVLPRGEARYRAGMTALLAMALCPMATAWHLLGTMDSSAVQPVLSAFAVHATASGGTLANDLAPGMAWQRWLDAALPWLVLAWSLGVMLLSWRAWRQWRRLRVMVRMAGPLPAWQQRAASMAVRFGLHRPMQVLRSAAIGAPVLVGWLRPVILLPVAVVAGFPETQIEWVLAHELAHLRRWDPLANLFQVTLETLYFHHPVVHWISRDVRNERELCCDALALSCRGGDPREFAATLAGLGELQAARGALLLAANGGVLLERVRRLAVPMPQAPASPRAPARFVAAWLGAILLAVVLQLEWQQASVRRQLILSMESWSTTLAKPLQSVTWKLPDLVPVHLRAAVPVRIDVTEPADSLPAITPALSSLMPVHWQVQTLTILAAGHPVHTVPLPPVELTAQPPLVEEAPRVIRMRQPVYPVMALERGIKGRVVIEFGLASGGEVRGMRVVDAEPAGVFERAALSAMGAWRYAAPDGTASGRRYRQVLVFDPAPASASGNGEVFATDDACHVVTGSHICRRYDEGSGVGGAVGAAGK